MHHTTTINPFIKGCTTSYENFHHANQLTQQLGLFDKATSVPIHLPDKREVNIDKFQPDWRLLFELLKDTYTSLEMARQIHNAINPDRTYSESRFRIKFDQELKRREAL